MITQEHMIVIVRLNKCTTTKIASFLLKPILQHKQVDCMIIKMLLTIFKYLFSFQRYSRFQNMQISQVMTSCTQPDFVQI